MRENIEDFSTKTLFSGKSGKKNKILTLKFHNIEIVVSRMILGRLKGFLNLSLIQYLIYRAFQKIYRAVNLKDFSMNKKITNFIFKPYSLVTFAFTNGY